MKKKPAVGDWVALTKGCYNTLAQVYGIPLLEVNALSVFEIIRTEEPRYECRLCPGRVETFFIEPIEVSRVYTAYDLLLRKMGIDIE